MDEAGQHFLHLKLGGAARALGRAQPADRLAVHAAPEAQRGAAHLARAAPGIVVLHPAVGAPFDDALHAAPSSATGSG